MGLSLSLGVPLMAEFDQYLGHQLLHKGNSCSSQREFLQKMKDGLVGWKSKRLSKAGRLALAKSVISNMEVFQMQLQKMTMRTHKEMDKAARQYV